MLILGPLTIRGFHQPNSLETTTEAAWAEHAKIQGRPSLQRVGSKSDTLTLAFHLHSNLLQPETFLQQLYDLKEAGTVLPLATEAGDALGDFVIQTVSVSRQHSMPDGSILDATVSVALIEWTTIDGVSERKFAARQAGFAVGTTGITDPPLTQAVEFQAMESTLAIGPEAAKIDSSLAAATVTPALEDHTRRTVTVSLAKILEEANFARTTINAFGGQKYTDTRGMETDLLAVIGSATTMQGLVQSASIADLRTMIQGLTALNATLHNTAQILSRYAGSRS